MHNNSGRVDEHSRYELTGHFRVIDFEYCTTFIVGATNETHAASTLYYFSTYFVGKMRLMEKH